MAGFDIGIGWHSPRSCGSWSIWAFSFVANQALGEVASNHYKMTQFTMLGLYFRIFLLTPLADIRNETEECVTGNYMRREIDAFADADKNKVIQMIYRNIKGMSKEQTARYTYLVLESFTRDVEAHVNLWHGRKPN